MRASDQESPAALSSDYLGLFDQAGSSIQKDMKAYSDRDVKIEDLPHTSSSGKAKTLKIKAKETFALLQNAGNVFPIIGTFFSDLILELRAMPATVPFATRTQVVEQCFFALTSSKFSDTKWKESALIGTVIITLAPFLLSGELKIKFNEAPLASDPAKSFSLHDRQDFFKAFATQLSEHLGKTTPAPESALIKLWGIILNEETDNDLRANTLKALHYILCATISEKYIQEDRFNHNYVDETFAWLVMACKDTKARTLLKNFPGLPGRTHEKIQELITVESKAAALVSANRRGSGSSPLQSADAAEKAEKPAPKITTILSRLSGRK